MEIKKHEYGLIFLSEEGESVLASEEYLRELNTALSNFFFLEDMKKQRDEDGKLPKQDGNNN